MADESHYKVLGVRPMADLDAIKRAYREKIRQHHPDRFAGERARIQREGTATELREIDRKIEQAQKQTQRINHAYSVLSDVVQRSNYDRSRAGYGPTASTSSTSGPPPPRTPRNERLPWVWLGGLVLVVFLGLWLVNSVLGGISNTPILNPAGSSGGPSARQLQATESARQATRTVRDQAVSQPSSTPRSPADFLSSADAFMELGFYELALESYDAAYNAHRDDPQFYFKRGQAYAGLASGQPGDAAEAALVNYRRALFLQPDWNEVFQERGLLYYALWQNTDETTYAELARADLGRLTDPNASVQSALNRLAID